jgi:glycosyltransferase involved in cell wall biosynthesis
MVKEEIAELYRVDKSRIFVTGAGYNDEIFVNIKKPVPPPVVICYAGKLSRSKGVPWLLKALKKLPETGWEFHLCGSGTGQENEECLRLASELGRRMTVHGAVHQNELARIMQKSHIFILPSFYEGLPLVVLEALASGCRIIATDLPGIREIASKTSEGSVTQIRTPRLHSIDEPFEDDEGNFVNELADSISSVMQKVMEKPDLTDEGVKLFTWSGVFEQVQEVYRKVLK